MSLDPSAPPSVLVRVVRVKREPAPSPTQPAARAHLEWGHFVLCPKIFIYHWL